MRRMTNMNVFTRLAVMWQYAVRGSSSPFREYLGETESRGRDRFIYNDLPNYWLWFIIAYNCCGFCSKLGFIYLLFSPDVWHLLVFCLDKYYIEFLYWIYLSRKYPWIFQTEWRGEGSIDGISYKWTAWHWAYTPKAYCHGT